MRSKPKSTLARDLGQEVRALRQARGLTIEALAKAARVDRAWLCRLEAGVIGTRGPGILSINRIAVPLGRAVTVEGLLRRAR